MLITLTEIEFAELKKYNRYENHLYWCHQMFAKSWTPGPPGIEDDM
jgi:hypothetical protein